MAKKHKEGRGRLSKIDLLPDEARPFVVTAIEALKVRERTQEAIREEMNLGLLSLGLDPISKSSFNRHALQVAAFGRQLQQAREVAAIMAEKLDETPQGDVGLLLNETIKTLVYDVIMEASLDDESASIAMLKAASDALMRLERARKLSVDTRSKIEKEFVKKASNAIDEAVETGAIDKQAANAARQIMGFGE